MNSPETLEVTPPEQAAPWWTGFDAATAGTDFSFTRRALVGGVALMYFVVGFSAVAVFAGTARLHTLRTPIDDAIPLVPWTVYLYSCVYTAAFFPVFVVRSARLFQRTILAYVLLMSVSFACFILYPVTSIGLRPDVATMADQTFYDWGLRLTYFIDPPVNLFPSLHVGLAAMSVLAAGTASRKMGLLALPVAVAILITISTTKQHFVADGIAALALAGAIWWVTLRNVPVDKSAEPTFGWRGVAAYVAFHGSLYGGFFVAYRMGFHPWR